MRFQQNAIHTILSRRFGIHDSVIDTFLIKIFRGNVELLRLAFYIRPCATEGSVEVADILEHDGALEQRISRILRGRSYWRWHDLTRTLLDNLTLSTGGRYVVRFHSTPASDGRGESELAGKMARSGADGLEL